MIAEQAGGNAVGRLTGGGTSTQGRGLACMEAAITDKGFDLRRSIMTRPAGAGRGAPKKGAASGRVPAAGKGQVKACSR